MKIPLHHVTRVSPGHKEGIIFVEPSKKSFGLPFSSSIQPRRIETKEMTEAELRELEKRLGVSPCNCGKKNNPNR